MSSAGTLFLMLASAFGSEVAGALCSSYSLSDCPTNGGGCQVANGTNGTNGTCSTGGCGTYNTSNCPTSTGCEVSGEVCALETCAVNSSKTCANYSAYCCAGSAGEAIVQIGCGLGTTAAYQSSCDLACTVNASLNCSGYSDRCCPASTGCGFGTTAAYQNTCDLACSVNSSWSCSTYSTRCCPTSTGCAISDGLCGLLGGSSPSPAPLPLYCTVNSSLSCSGYNATCCPTSTGCGFGTTAAYNSTCDLACTVNSSWSCSTYSTRCCPTSTGCAISDGLCGLPGGSSPSPAPLPSYCTIDSSKGCSDYNATCCPTSTGCQLADGRCALQVPSSDCAIKFNAGCEDYTATCCPTTTGCAVKNNACVLPGSDASCAVNSSWGCANYTTGCCPTATGCEITEDAKCALESTQGSEVSETDQAACMSTCPVPGNLTDLSLMCPWMQCLSKSSACSSVMSALKKKAEFSVVVCSCSAEPKMSAMLAAMEGGGSCTDAAKSGLDLCNVTGSCRDVLKQGLDHMISESQCQGLLSQLNASLTPSARLCTMSWNSGKEGAPTTTAPATAAAAAPASKVVGSLTLTVSDCAAFVAQSGAAAAIKSALAAATGAEVNNIEVQLTCPSRRLASAVLSRRLGTSVAAAYEIAIPAGSRTITATSVVTAIKSSSPTAMTGLVTAALTAANLPIAGVSVATLPAPAEQGSQKQGSQTAVISAVAGLAMMPATLAVLAVIVAA
ncbi:unnamed protein product [Polarella glacialis]|uniref:Uncharacterized protein n=1 Tax=Polarella glacialis TaxID=89957 RepID=A0A813LTG6_POLGL|nr:unnamed protein product [Polarella glacialis]